MTPAKEPAVFMVWCTAAECCEYDFGPIDNLKSRGWALGNEPRCPWDRGRE